MTGVTGPTGPNITVVTDAVNASTAAISSGAMYSLLYGYTGTMQVSNLTCTGLFISNGTTQVNRMSERVSVVSNATTGNVNVSWTGQNSVYYVDQPPTGAGANVIFRITELPLTAANTYTTYNCCMVVNAVTSRSYANGIVLNGVQSNTLLKINNGAANVSVSAANTIVQSFVIMCLDNGSSPWRVLSTVNPFVS